jgi:uncharacterized membrane protein YbhN (UPF0104 family)
VTRSQHPPSPGTPDADTPIGPGRPATELRIPSLRTLLRLGLQAAAIGLVANAILVVMTVEPGTWRQVAGWKWQAAPVLVGLMVVSWTVNGLRVQLMAWALNHRLTLGQALSISLPAMFGTAATPSSIGAPILRLGLSRRAGIPLANAAAMTAANYTIDMVYFAVLTPFAVAVVLHDPKWRRTLGRIEAPDPRIFAAMGVVALLVIAGVLWYRSRSDRRLLAGLRDRLRVGERAGRTGAALRELVRHRPGALLLDLGLAAVQWTARYTTLPVILWAMGVTLNPVPLILLQAGLFAFGPMLVVPGGGGGVEALSVFLLSGLVPDGTVGVVVLIWRAVTYHLGLVVSGTVLVLVLGHLDRVFGPAPRTPPSTHG